MPLEPGRKLGPYEIIGALGKGGMGEVYRARDPRLGRDVAIKVLRETLADDTEALKRFRREVKALAAVSHPNILDIHDFGTENGVSYAVMELLDGETLRKLISQGPIPWQKALEIGISIADGLATAHSKGVIHRDLKPENTFLTSDGRVIILDFGLASLMPSASHDTGEATTMSIETDGGVIRGTIPYMSPEQLRGVPADARSDIFSFGCILYEMAAGGRAFSRDTGPETMSAILTENPKPLKNVPQGLDEIIQHCLQKNPEQRVQSARDLAFDLRKILSHPEQSRTVPIGTRFHFSARFAAWILATLLAAIGTIILLNPKGLRERISGQAKTERIESLAVLPLKNLSGDPSQEYFADGMTEELIATLARIESLRVISRTSVMEYKDARKSLPNIAKELNVDAVLEGSVLQDGGRVRITAQLIDGRTDRHLWSDSYERDLRNILALQNEVTRSIVQEIKVKLTPQEKAHLEGAPAIHPEAYQAYLRGLDYRARPEISEENLRLAAEMFDRAIELDPKFVNAYTELSIAHSAIFHFGHDRTEDRLKKAKDAATRAFELQPDLAEGHVALGYYYYWGRRDYAQALKEFGLAVKNLPNSSKLRWGTGSVQRRQGMFNESIENMKRALELNPRDAYLAQDIGLTYSVIRKYADAEVYYDRSIPLAPDTPLPYKCKAWNFWAWKGTTDQSRLTLQKMPQKQDSGWSLGNWFWQEFYQRNYQAALDRLSSSDEPFKGVTEFLPRSLLAGFVYQAMNQPDKASASFQTARTQLEKELQSRPDDARIHSSLGMAYAGLQRKSEAVHEGKTAVELYPVSRDAFEGPDYVRNLAIIYVMIGDESAATDRIAYLLSIPSFFSIPLMKLDPRFDPLRGSSQYQKLLLSHKP